MRISLFIACYNDTLFPETGKAVVRLLERLGHEVDFPLDQTCCGQMHFNSGYHRETVPIARQFLKAFRDAETVLVPSSSCTAMIRQQFGRVAEIAGDPGMAEAARDLAPRVFELTELLTDRLGMEDVGAYFPHRVTYHPTCNSLRALRLGDRPLRLLRNVAGIELVELPQAQECCGFGGTFAIKNADTSIAMLADKMRHVMGTRAEICTAVDNSCLMHIGGGLNRLRSGVRAMHIAEILASTEEDPLDVC
ncbi:MAG TPA: (Fe-S)-binding protein [Arenibaculum sp.]|nr:(Fe-S)-binding protein [Arenibaculum sp.]